MKRYDSYKDSGIEWIGEIPAHWKLRRIDWIANIIRGNTGFKKDELLERGEFVALQYGKTYKVDVVDNSFNFFVNSEFYKESQVVSKGDTVLISTSETIEDLGHVCYYDNDNIGLLGGEQILLQPNRNVLYEKYLFQYARQFGLELKKYAKGLKVFRFNTSDLKQLFIAIPSIEEQSAIANYLDQKITQIDDLISKKEHLIQLLEEERVAIINQAVTKGLDPTVPMKDSGIEWLGEIPAHWVVKMLKFVTSLITNGFVGPTRDLYYETGVRYIQSLHIKKGKIDFERSPYYVSEEWSNDHPRSILKEGDVLVVQTGAVGEVAMVDKDYEDCNCHALIIVRTNEKLIPVFILNLLESSFGKAQMKLIETGALHQHINSTKLKDIITIVPPIEEQSQIVRFIEEQRGRIQTVINKTQQEIELLKEYKTALISEVVTGKVDVRDGK